MSNWFCRILHYIIFVFAFLMTGMNGGLGEEDYEEGMNEWNIGLNVMDQEMSST